MAIRFAWTVMRVAQLLDSGFAVLVVGGSHVREELFAVSKLLKDAAIQRKNLASLAIEDASLAMCAVELGSGPVSLPTVGGRMRVGKSETLKSDNLVMAKKVLGMFPAARS